MNNSEALDLMLSRLGNRKNFPRPLLLRELNEKIKEKERGSFLPWFLEGTWEAVILEDTQYMALPADFLQEVEDGRLELVSSTSKHSYPKKRPFEKMQQVYSVYQEGGEPAVYSLWGGRLYLAPMPSTGYAISLPYFKKTPEVADDASLVTSWLAEATNYIMYATLKDVAANDLQNQEAAARFSALASEAYVTLYKFNEARKHTNADYVIGEE